MDSATQPPLPPNININASGKRDKNNSDKYIILQILFKKQTSHADDVYKFDGIGMNEI